MLNPIYLDYNATTPIDSEVAKAMQPYLDLYYGNPSSSHKLGITTRKAVENARSQIAHAIGCHPDEIIFTSGGTESNNMAIKGIAYANKHKGNHIITSAVEHPAVTEVCRFLRSNGFEVTYLPVDQFGMVNPDVLSAAIRSTSILVSIMHANNETGTIQPINEIAAIAKNHNIIFHTDAAQSLGKIPVNVSNLGIDLLSIAGHKLYAPKGIGALYIKSGTNIEKLIHGADHERNLRAGTENILEIVGLGKACEKVSKNLDENMQHLKLLRDTLHKNLTKEFPEIKLNGHPEYRLPNTLNISFPGIEANTLLSELPGIAASAGAACHAEKVDISSVLQAMKVPTEYAMGAVRFSVGKYTTIEEINKASNLIIEVIKRIQQAVDTSQPSMVSVDHKIKLTQFTHGLGCACKIKPQELEKILKKLPKVRNDNVLIDTQNADDAAVYRINSEQAIIQTLDFFTPIVDDPYHFGAVAAANALSDIYAMGGKPLFALNIMGFPLRRLSATVMEDILKGANDKATEAGISIIGGHTIEDTEPKYGMAVTGIIHPDKILTNGNAQKDDVIILTKPIGTGIISTAVKNGAASEEEIDEFIKIMSALNNTAAEVMNSFQVNACTDVTGFGLLGHLKEMTTASKIKIEVFHDKVPLINSVRKHAANQHIPGGTKNNHEYVSDVVKWDKKIPLTEQYLLCDAQTSGGLLISLPEKDAKKLLAELNKKGIKNVSIIGKIIDKGEGEILVK